MTQRRNPTIPLLILAAVVLLLSWTAGMAGDYHSGTTLFCQDCHNMHFSQTHGYNADGGGFTTPLGSAGPYSYLLRDEINTLCLNCHDGGGPPDVLANNSNSGLRSAGALNRDNTAPYFDATGHTLNFSGTAPGGSWTPPNGQFECTDCHQPHGYGAGTANPYRNLSGTITSPFGLSVSYEIAPFASATNNYDVIEIFPAAYDQDFVNYQEPIPAGYPAWCGNCHPDFHGDPGSGNIGGSGSPPEHFDRHPVQAVDIGAIGGGHSSIDVYWGWDSTGGANTGKVNFVKVMSPGQGWPTNGALATSAGPDMLTPSCFSCHKPHGNQNSFGLIYMENTGVVTEEGTASGGYRDLCMQCHVQGG